MMQFAAQVTIKLISQLVKSIAIVPHKNTSKGVSKV